MTTNVYSFIEKTASEAETLLDAELYSVERGGVQVTVTSKERDNIYACAYYRFAADDQTPAWELRINGEQIIIQPSVADCFELAEILVTKYPETLDFFGLSALQAASKAFGNEIPDDWEILDEADQDNWLENNRTGSFEGMTNDEYFSLIDCHADTLREFGAKILSSVVDGLMSSKDDVEVSDSNLSIEQRYVKTGGLECPICTSSDLSCSSFQSHGNGGSRGVSCDNCQSEWDEDLTITDMFDLNNKVEFLVGESVAWIDPDNGLASGVYTIDSFINADPKDGAAYIKNDAGSEAEVPISELVKVLKTETITEKVPNCP